MQHWIPYGNNKLEFELPWQADVIAPPNFESPIPELTIPPVNLDGYSRAVIIFTDSTRHSPDQWLCEKILESLSLAPEKITFLCAIGMHRPSTHVEKVAKLGRGIVEKYQVIDHDPKTVVTIGEIDGIPIEVNPLLAEPKTFVIMTGVVEPHQYAGYSGGAKTAVIGCGGANTIRLTHGPKMLDQNGVRLGKIEGNPFQEFVRKAGELIGLNLAVNVVMPKKVAFVEFGNPQEVHDSLVAKARKIYETPVPHGDYDIVIGGVTPPKDANLYQASRAATYLGLSANPVIRKGGTIIVAAPLPEGAGEGAGEQNFYEALEKWKPTQTLIRHFREQGCRPGEQRAYMIAQLLQDYEWIFVGANAPNLLNKIGITHAPDMQTAIELAPKRGDNRHPKVLVVQEALKSIPVQIISRLKRL